MAKVMVLKGGKILESVTAAPMTREQRDAERAALDADSGVMLFEIIPSCSAEWAPGAWGEYRMPEREEARFRAMAATF